MSTFNSKLPFQIISILGKLRLNLVVPTHTIPIVLRNYFSNSHSSRIKHNYSIETRWLQELATDSPECSFQVPFPSYRVHGSRFELPGQTFPIPAFEFRFSAPSFSKSKFQAFNAKIIFLVYYEYF